MNLLAWMLAVVAVGGMLAFAAWLLEWIAARYATPRRFGWALALLLALVLPALPLAFGSWGSDAPAAQQEELTAEILPSTDVGMASEPHATWFLSALARGRDVFYGVRLRLGQAFHLPEVTAEWNRALAWGWAGLSLLTLLLFVFGPFQLARQSRAWESLRILDREVRLAPKNGPLVLGFWRPRIILPAPYRDLPEDDLQVVIDHEEEHIRAGDPRLLVFGMLPVILFPWSPGVWWMFHRLRIALEVDCDRRVLARGVHAVVYGGLLVRLGLSYRTTPLTLHPLTLSARPSILERRLQAMTRSTTSTSLPTSIAAASIAMAVLLLACATTPPVGSDAPGAEGAAPTTTAADLSAEPVFTPFTVAPEVRNRAEIRAALEANYPEEVRSAGIGGTALLFFFIDADGQVQNIRIHQTSGLESLDQAALRVARIFQFTPAMNRDTRVPVWVQIPITFTTGG